MINFTTAARKECAAATIKLATAGVALFRETDPAKIKAKAEKRDALKRRQARKNK